MTNRIHPLAEIFPMLPDEELAALATSIADNGLRHPILIAECPDPETGELVEMIVDGRNRLEACRRAQVAPRFDRLNGVDIASLILAENVDRRNLNAGQRAMARAMLEKEPEKGGRGKLSRNREGFGKAESNAVSQARFVVRNDPTLARAVMAGTESLNAAYETARARVGAATSAEAKLATIRAAAPDIAAMVDEGAIGLDAAIAELAERQRREAEARESARRSAAIIVDQLAGHVATVLSGMQLGEPPPAPDRIRQAIGILQKLLAKAEEKP